MTWGHLSISAISQLLLARFGSNFKQRVLGTNTTTFFLGTFVHIRNINIFTQNFVGPKILFRPKILFGPKIFGPAILLDPRFFQDQIFFRPKNFVGLKFFPLPKNFGPQTFLGPTFFGPKFFLTQNFVRPKISYSKFLRIQNFF